MRIVKIPTNYYQQFNADYTLQVPAEGYGGWKKEEMELDLDHTAVVLMHATDYGTMEQVPGVFRACEWIPRAYYIGKNIMPGLLDTIRNAGVKLFHISSQSFCQDYPGYKKVKEMGINEAKFEQVKKDPVIENLWQFKREYCFPGKNNLYSYEVMDRIAKYPEGEKPKDNEEIVTDQNELFEVCKKYEINHLIYVGYNINWCILFASGGIFYMARHGIMCSTIRQAVTSVENKETAQKELGKESALWTIALGFGYVYDIDDFINSISL